VEIQDEEGMRTSMEREGESVNETFRYKTIKDIVKFLEDQIPSPSAAESYDIKNPLIRGERMYPTQIGRS